MACSLILVSLAGARADAAPLPQTWTIARADLLPEGRAVRMTYADGRQTVISTSPEDDNFDAPVISSDRLSVGWSIERHVDASYAIPMDVQIYRYGKRSAGAGYDAGVAGDWYFWGGGKQVVLVCGFPHGLPSTHLVLADVMTGKELGTVAVDDETGKVAGSAPAWAKADANTP